MKTPGLNGDLDVAVRFVIFRHANLPAMARIPAEAIKDVVTLFLNVFLKSFQLNIIKHALPLKNFQLELLQEIY